MSNTNRDAATPDAAKGAPGPGRPVPGGAEADFAEKGPAVVDDKAGLSEAEKLEDAVEDLSTDKR